MMKRLSIYICCIALALITCNASAKIKKHNKNRFFKADDPNISYTGRWDVDNPGKHRFWSPGVYAEARFVGTSLTVFVNDEGLYGGHNYIVIIIDGIPHRMQLQQKENKILAADNLTPGEHTVIIDKDSEANIGYIDFAGLECEKLLPVKKPKHKIEFIGDSITCGFGDDDSQIKCGTGKWYDQNSAWISYGALTARALNAQYVITAVSGIGMMHSCCNLPITMPQVFDKVSLRADSIRWDFSKYTPDVVTICLGQNDGLQDSTAFCSAYLAFVNRIKTYYPKADIVCLGSPMANDQLRAQMRRYIPAIVNTANADGRKKVSYYIFSQGYNAGCATHPSGAEHQQIAAQVTAYLRQLENW
jgi:lysophospholipase L1-like esterase